MLTHACFSELAEEQHVDLISTAPHLVQMRVAGELSEGCGREVNDEASAAAMTARCPVSRTTEMLGRRVRCWAALLA